MNKKLYDLMDWAEIEAIVYGEADRPQDLLGPHNVGKQTLVQAFFPNAKRVTIYVDGIEGQKGKTVKEEIKMEEMDEAGFYAALLSGKDRRDYSFHVEYETDKVTKSGKKSIKSVNYKDCYSFTKLITEKMAEKFLAGNELEAYSLLGSQLMTIDGVRGCRFAVWAPNAMRVSVVGDFNNWNPLMNQMMRSEAEGIFELFIPGVEEGSLYKYEILSQGKPAVLKADPYSISQESDKENRAESASVVTNNKGFKWQDEVFVKNRKKIKASVMPYNAYEVYLGALLDGDKCKSLKDIAKEFTSYVKAMNFTHVELMPISEYVKDDCVGYHTAWYFAPTNRYGTANDYKFFINELHKAGIGVVLQMPVNSFDNVESGLAYFDGTGLYESEDHRKGIDPRNGKLIFQYSQNEVRSFLLSVLNYYVKEFHVDGYKLCDIASMLYLDYYRQPGEWIPNIYGGNENLEAIDFIKEVNKVLHKEYPGILTIAEDASGWPNLTVNDQAANKQVDVESLGFDMALDLGYSADIMEYMHADPILRKHLHDKLTVSSIYQYNENFILPISHENASASGLIAQMPGNMQDKISSLKAFYGYNMMRVGKKQMFMGQEYGAQDAFQAWMKLDKELINAEGHKELAKFCEDMNAFYLNHAFLYEMDTNADGFAWINQMSANENVISFTRKGKKASEEITVIVNFANVEYAKYRIGSAKQGKYKEIFNSDLAIYFGKNIKNDRLLATKEEAYDGRDYSFALRLAPLSIVILSFEPYTDAELKEIAKKKALREKKRQDRENKRLKEIADKEKKYELLAKEKAKIRAELKAELERRYKEAEEKILGKK